MCGIGICVDLQICLIESYFVREQSVTSFYCKRLLHETHLKKWKTEFRKCHGKLPASTAGIEVAFKRLGGETIRSRELRTYASGFRHSFLVICKDGVS